MKLSFLKKKSVCIDAQTGKAIQKIPTPEEKLGVRRVYSLG